MTLHTFFLASPVGTTLSLWPDGDSAAESHGQALAPANRFRVPASAAARKMNGTSGRNFTVSSASAALSRSLANRLRAVMDLDGSTECLLTWRSSVMPSGRVICRLQASARPTGGNVCGGWPTSNAGPQNDGDTTWQERRAKLKAEHKNGNGFGMTMGQAVSTVAWPSPGECDSRSTRNSTANRKTVPPTGIHKGNTLTDAVSLAAWATPNSSAHKNRKGSSWRGEISQQVLGATSTSSGVTSGPPAKGSSRGALSPEHSRWLMGLPMSWILAAPLRARAGSGRSAGSGMP